MERATGIELHVASSEVLYAPEYLFGIALVAPRDDRRKAPCAALSVRSEVGAGTGLVRLVYGCVYATDTGPRRWRIGCDRQLVMEITKPVRSVAMWN